MKDLLDMYIAICPRAADFRAWGLRTCVLTYVSGKSQIPRLVCNTSTPQAYLKQYFVKIIKPQSHK